ncbi:hypothetical protein [Pedobacter cryoconitis]|uniref:Uncharacterized protein n=1 Tax=Pedobacter cryoconitis TaxID=188932 RepID=A0A327S4D5_9SPHI|nr:hypothetical protein [Pedobacter cryoconitis]RAJ22884.1 hypothetical protein LY11_04588 [Pedobacter cryoconitis]
MNKRIQTWSTIKDGKRVPYTGKVKSFNEYQAEVRTEKLLQKAFTDHLLQQLAEARQIPLKEDKAVIEALNELKEMVVPLTDNIEFIKNKYTKPVHKPSKKTISKAEKQAAIINKIVTRGKKLD